MQTIFVIVWIMLNLFAVSLQWDPYPFILLNLAFSTQAAYAAPLILLAQNRQENRDRVSLEEDRRRAEQTKADTEYLARELAALRLAVGEVATRDYLRRELEEMREMLTGLQQQATTGGDGAGKSDASERRSKQIGLNPLIAIAATIPLSTRYGDLVHTSPQTKGRLSAHRGRGCPRGSAAPSRASRALACFRHRHHRPDHPGRRRRRVRALARVHRFATAR